MLLWGGGWQNVQRCRDGNLLKHYGVIPTSFCYVCAEERSIQ